MSRWYLSLALALTACTPAPAGVALSPVAKASVAPSVAPIVPVKQPVALPPSVPPTGSKPRPYVPDPVLRSGGKQGPAVPAGTAPDVSGTPGPQVPGTTGPMVPGTAQGAGASSTPQPAPQVPAAGEIPQYTGAWLLRLPAGTDTSTLLPGYRQRGQLTLGSGLLLRVDPPAGQDPAITRADLAAYQATPEPRRHRQDFDFTKPDPFYRFQWAHRADRAATTVAWELVPAPNQAKIVVAVLDTGMDVTHPEFVGRIVEPRNFTDVLGPTEVRDLDGHGTHVAGIVGAAGDNDAGVAGVAWGAKIMPVKVLANDGGGDEFDILAGFLFAARWRPVPEDNSRVRVINMSLGSPTGAVMALWADAVAEARAAGVVVIAAAGNAGAESVDAPANTPGVLAVGSSNDYLAWEDVSPFSNHGARLDLVAPGEDIMSTAPILGSPIGEAYAYLSGTSMASPYVAGVAALVVAKYDGDNFRMDGTFSEAVHRRLLRACDDLGVPGRDPWFGEGRLNARRAVSPPNIDDVP